MLHLSLNKIYFDAIKKGTKTVEGRINSEKFRQLTEGSKIYFTTPDDSATLECTALSKHLYASFEEMLQAEGFKNTIPTATSLEEAVHIYESFPGYQEKVKTMGTLAIRISYQQR